MSVRNALLNELAQLEGPQNAAKDYPRRLCHACSRAKDRCILRRFTPPSADLGCPRSKHRIVAGGCQLATSQKRGRLHLGPEGELDTKLHRLAGSTSGYLLHDGWPESSSPGVTRFRRLTSGLRI